MYRVGGPRETGTTVLKTANMYTSMEKTDIQSNRICKCTHDATQLVAQQQKHNLAMSRVESRPTEQSSQHRSVTNCPAMPKTVPESRVCVSRPGQMQSGTIKCPGIKSKKVIMVKELLYLAHAGIKLTFNRPNVMPTAFI